MASVRLTNVSRQGIISRVLAHRFSKEVCALSECYTALARDIYYDTYTEAERRRMRRLPEGWLPQSTHISVVCGGMYRSLSFSGTVYSAELRALRKPEDMRERHSERVLACHVNVSHKYAATHPVAIALERLANQESSLVACVRVAGKELMAALNLATTQEGLLKLWPELEPFMLKVVAGPVSSTLPAVPIKELNAKFNLPVKKQVPVGASKKKELK